MKSKKNYSSFYIFIFFFGSVSHFPKTEGIFLMAFNVPPYFPVILCHFVILHWQSHSSMAVRLCREKRERATAF